jgi:hypothetical protein
MNIGTGLRRGFVSVAVALGLGALPANAREAPTGPGGDRPGVVAHAGLHRAVLAWEPPSEELSRSPVTIQRPDGNGDWQPVGRPQRPEPHLPLGRGHELERRRWCIRVLAMDADSIPHPISDPDEDQVDALTCRGPGFVL